MADVDLSEAEKTFILHGIQDNFREDGRGCEDFRYMEVETGLISNTNGSARVRLASTDVLVGVKVQLTPVNPKKPKVGRLEFFLDCSANATPAFEGRGGEELASEITAMLTRAYSSPGVIDFTSLCVLPGQQCWLLYIDILEYFPNDGKRCTSFVTSATEVFILPTGVALLECGGNLFDAVSIGVKAALFNLQIPNVTMTRDEGGIELDVSDDPYDFKRLDVTGAPVIVTVNKIGRCHVVDASEKEEACSLARVLLSVTENGTITAMRKEGAGSLDIDSVADMTDSAKKVGVELNKSLLKVLKEEEMQGTKPVGFLRFLTDQRKSAQTSEKQVKRKILDEEIQFLKKKRKTAEDDARQLNIEDDRLSLKAQKQRCFTLLERANARHLSSKDKQDQVVILISKLYEKEEEQKIY